MARLLLAGPLLAMFLLRIVGAFRDLNHNTDMEQEEFSKMTELTMENLQKTQLLLEEDLREVHAQKDTLAAENERLKAEIAKFKGGTVQGEDDQEEKLQGHEHVLLLCWLRRHQRGRLQVRGQTTDLLPKPVTHLKETLGSQPAVITFDEMA